MHMAKKKRLYQPIWEKIRDTGKCSISAPSPMHKRIIKAVIKEKGNDLGFKVLSAEKWRWNKLSYTISGSMITFTLTHDTSLEDL